MTTTSMTAVKASTRSAQVTSRSPDLIHSATSMTMGWALPLRKSKKIGQLKAAPIISAPVVTTLAAVLPITRPPKPVDPAAERLFALVEQAGAALGLAIARCDTGGVCDGNNIAACGVPVVDTMGVRGGAIHSMEEYLIVESLAERAALSALTIIRLAGELP